MKKSHSKINLEPIKTNGAPVFYSQERVIDFPEGVSIRMKMAISPERGIIDKVTIYYLSYDDANRNWRVHTVGKVPANDIMQLFISSMDEMRRYFDPEPGWLTGPMWKKR